MDRLQLSWDDQNRPYSEAFGDHFYSRADGRAECQHVFLAGNNLPQRWQTAASFRIAELGFGTGLNFLETWRLWRENRQHGQKLDVISFEAFPLDSMSIGRAILPWPELQSLSAKLIDYWPSLSATPVTWALDSQTNLTIIINDALIGVGSWGDRADAWFLDGFAPSRNPEMWSAPLMQAVFDRTKPGGTFATYTAAGWVRRNLHDAGFEVRKIPGYANKRHMSAGQRKT